MIDTGASCSLIRKNIYIYMQLSDSARNLRRSTRSLRSVHSNLLEIEGITELKFDEFQEKIRLVVTDETVYQCIIGNDILYHCNLIGSTNERQLIYNGIEYKLGKIAGVDHMSLSKSEAYTKYEEINIIIGIYKHLFCNKGDTN